MPRSGATDPCRYIEQTLPETGRLIIRRVSHCSPSIPVKSPQLVLALLAGDLAVTHRLAGEVISLPMHPYLEDADIQRVTDTVRASLAS